MATVAKLTVRVTSSRSASVVKVGTTGRYIATPMNDIEIDATGQPIFTTASPKAFWTAVLAVCQAEIAALPLCLPSTGRPSYRPSWRCWGHSPLSCA